jgi:hypothetical protein
MEPKNAIGAKVGEKRGCGFSTGFEFFFFCLPLLMLGPVTLVNPRVWVQLLP